MNSVKILVPILAAFCLSSAHAQSLTWTSYRHDPLRSGAAEGQGEITRPAVQVRLSAGTTTQSRFFTHLDIDGDGRHELLLADAGRVVARDLDDRLFWNSANLEISYLHGLYDFDGDGAVELLGLGRQGLVIVDPQNGNILWHKTDFAPNNNTTHDRNTLVGDIDGDGLPDIVVKAEWTSDKSLHRYSFADGINTEQPDLNEVWVYPLCDACFTGGIFPILGDVDADGDVEVVVHGWKTIEVISGVSGSLEQLYLDLPFIQYLGPSRLMQMDEDEQLEILHVARGDGDSAGISVSDVVKFPESLAAYDFFDPDIYRLRASVEFAADLTGDGFPEIVVSRDDGNQWSTLIYAYDESDEGGAELVLGQTLEGLYTRSLVDPDGDGRYQLVAENTLSGQTSPPAYPLVELLTYNGPGDSESQWSLQGAELAQDWKANGFHENGIFSMPSTTLFDVNRDGLPELLFQQDLDGDLRADRLVAMNGDGEVVKDLSYQGGTALSVLESTDSVSSFEAGQELLVLVDGRIRILNDDLQILPYSVAAGAYEPETLVADLQGDGEAELVFRSSSGAVQVYDGKDLFQSEVEAQPLWSYSGLDFDAPIFLGPDEQGHYRTIFAYRRVAGQTTLEIYESDGTKAGGVVVNEELADNLLAADFTGDDFPDIIGTYASGIDEFSTILINGKTLFVEWTAVNPIPSNIPTEQRTVAFDANGDGLKDFCMGIAPQFTCMSGADGSSLGKVNSDLQKGAPMVGQIDGDDALDIVLVNQSSVESYSPTLDEEWSLNRGEGEDEDWYVKTFTNKGSLADADNDGIQELFAATNDNRLYSFTGDGTQRFRKVLKGGLVTENDEDVSVSIVLDRTITGDVDGDGIPEVLVGSSDGYLYCLSTLDGSLEWSISFFERVTRPVLADIDGDGLLEVVVTVGDGFIHLIDQATLAASALVKDVPVLDGGGADAQSEDIDESEAAAGLAASWAAVEGAQGYWVAILNENDALTVPWTDVGLTTSVVLTNGNFVYDQIYHYAVQAYDVDGVRGSLANSDGVRIVDLSDPIIESLQAEPEYFNPEFRATSITATLTDQTGLSSYELVIQNPENEDVFSQSLAVASTSYDLVLEWTGKDDAEQVLDDGEYIVHLAASDQRANQVSDEVEVVVDTIAPAAPVVSYPEANSDITEQELVAEGSAEAWAIISLSIDDLLYCETTVSESGDWECTFEEALALGGHELIVQATDRAENVSEQVEVLFNVVAEETPTASASPTITPDENTVEQPTPTAAEQTSPPELTASPSLSNTETQTPSVSPSEGDPTATLSTTATPALNTASTDTEVPPTATQVEPSATQVEATVTAVEPTATQLEPTASEPQQTNTETLSATASAGGTPTKLPGDNTNWDATATGDTGGEGCECNSSGKQSQSWMAYLGLLMLVRRRRSRT